MFEKEYYKQLLKESLIENNFLKDTNKSYSHKPHLASLPYDHNTNNIDNLQERVDEIDNRMDALNEERNNIADDIDSLKRKIRNFGKDDEVLQKEAFDSVKSIQDRFHEELSGYDIGKPVIDGKPNPVFLDIQSLNELFEYSGLIDGMSANGLMETANNIVDFAYEYTGGDDTPWSNQVIGIADDLRALAENHNVNNNILGNNLDTYIEVNKDINNLYGAYRENRKLYHDYQKERIRTNEHIDKLR